MLGEQSREPEHAIRRLLMQAVLARARLRRPFGELIWGTSSGDAQSKPMIRRFLRFMTMGAISLAPNHVVFFCLLIFPALPAIFPAKRAANLSLILGTYVAMLCGFALSLLIADRFVSIYRNHSFKVDFLIFGIGFVPLGIHARAPGVMEPPAFGIASVVLGCWFLSFWNDRLFEQLSKPSIDVDTPSYKLSSQLELQTLDVDKPDDSLDPVNQEKNS